MPAMVRLLFFPLTVLLVKLADERQAQNTQTKEGMVCRCVMTEPPRPFAGLRDELPMTANLNGPKRQR